MRGHGAQVPAKRARFRDIAKGGPRCRAPRRWRDRERSREKRAYRSTSRSHLHGLLEEIFFYQALGGSEAIFGGAPMITDRLECAGEDFLRMLNNVPVPQDR